MMRNRRFIKPLTKESVTYFIEISNSDNIEQNNLNENKNPDLEINRERSLSSDSESESFDDASSELPKSDTNNSSSTEVELVNEQTVTASGRTVKPPDKLNL